VLFWFRKFFIEHRTAFRGTTYSADAFLSVEEKEALMRKLALGVVAGATLLTAAVPAMAQIGFYAGPFGVGVGRPYWGDQPYGGYYYDAPPAYDYYDAPPAYLYEAPPAYVAPGWRY
jgi:hypothetical protein